MPRWIALQAATMAVVAIASCAARLTPSAPVVTPRGVRFLVAARPSASGVAVAGSFNGWSTASHPMALTAADGLWEVVVSLPPGEHLFMFVVDGTEWVSPPQAEAYADDGFGSRNGVVVIRPAEQ